MSEYELKHWGIKGMKWGVRRFQNKDGSLTPAGRQRYDDAEDGDPKPTQKPRKKKISEMSDAELKAAIGRMELERRYADLTSQKQQATVNKGKDIFSKVMKYTGIKAAHEFASECVKTGALNVGKQLATYLIGAGVNNIAKNKFGITDAEGIVNPKKGQKDKK